VVRCPAARCAGAGRAVGLAGPDDAAAAAAAPRTRAELAITVVSLTDSGEDKMNPRSGTPGVLGCHP